MKHLLIALAFSASCCVSAQHVDRNDMVFSASPGMTLNDYDAGDSASFSSLGESFLGFRAPVSAEYAFSRVLGVSADFVYSRLFPSTPYASNFTVLDAGIGLRFYSPSSARLIHWFGGVSYHFSKLHFSYHSDFIHETITARGSALFFSVGANIALSENQKFGMGLSVNGSAYRYPKAQYADDFGTYPDFKMTGLALAAGINFYYKL